MTSSNPGKGDVDVQKNIRCCVDVGVSVLSSKRGIVLFLWMFVLAGRVGRLEKDLVVM